MFLLSCDSYSTASIIFFLKSVFSIICVLIPVFLAIKVIVKLIKIVTSDDKLDFSFVKFFLVRFFGGVLIAFLPLLVNAFFKVTGNNNMDESCFVKVDRNYLSSLKALEDAKDQAAKKEYEKNKAEREKEKAEKEKELAEKEKEEKEKVPSIDTSGMGGYSFDVNGFIYYPQSGPEAPWAATPYCNGYVFANAGCGPTSAAMIVANMVDKNVLPTDTGKWLVEHGYCGAGTDASGIKPVLEAYGLEVSKPYCYHASAYSGGMDLRGFCQGDDERHVMKEELLKGDAMILMSINNVTGKAIYTQSGHYLNVVGYDESKGGFLVADPNPNHKPYLTQGHPLESFDGDALVFWVVRKKS